MSSIPGLLAIGVHVVLHAVVVVLVLVLYNALVRMISYILIVNVLHKYNQLIHLSQILWPYVMHLFHVFNGQLANGVVALVDAAVVICTVRCSVLVMMVHVQMNNCARV